CFVLAGLLIATNSYAGDVRVKVRGAVGQRYDDNINYAESDTQNDFITVTTAGINLDFQDKRMQAYLNASITEELFWDHDEHNNTSERLSVYLARELSKHEYITISDTFSHTYEPVSFEEEFGRVGGRYSYYRNSFDAGYSRELTEFSSLQFGYGNDLDITSQSDRLDSYVNRFSVDGIYELSSQTQLLGSYNYLNRDLDPGSAATINTISATVRHNLTEQLSIEGRAGADIIDSYNGDMIARPLWSLKLTDQVTKRTSTNLTYTQRYSTNPYTSDVFNSWRISTGVDSQLTRRLKGSANAFYGYGEYDSLGIRDELVGVNTALSYEISKNFRGNISYSHSQTISNIDIREYRKNVIFVGVSADF
ncbi:MAG: outer membrane beta-barrel protein, partial [Candidatus Omnitrophica bacterium]|nr:outer membrane beta-barrel protein [Candidatus Omnitrophota bacterium]